MHHINNMCLLDICCDCCYWFCVRQCACAYVRVYFVMCVSVCLRVYTHYMGGTILIKDRNIKKFKLRLRYVEEISMSTHTSLNRNESNLIIWIKWGWGGGGMAALLDTTSITVYSKTILSGKKINLTFHKQTLLITKTNHCLLRVRWTF